MGEVVDVILRRLSRPATARAFFDTLNECGFKLHFDPYTIPDHLVVKAAQTTWVKLRKIAYEEENRDQLPRSGVGRLSLVDSVPGKP